MSDAVIMELINCYHAVPLFWNIKLAIRRNGKRRNDSGTQSRSSTIMKVLLAQIHHQTWRVNKIGNEHRYST